MENTVLHFLTYKDITGSHESEYKVKEMVKKATGSQFVKFSKSLNVSCEKSSVRVHYCNNGAYVYFTLILPWTLIQTSVNNVELADIFKVFEFVKPLRSISCMKKVINTKKLNLFTFDKLYAIYAITKYYFNLMEVLTMNLPLACIRYENETTVELRCGSFCKLGQIILTRKNNTKVITGYTCLTKNILMWSKCIKGFNSETDIRIYLERLTSETIFSKNMLLINYTFTSSIESNYLHYQEKKTISSAGLRSDHKINRKSFQVYFPHRIFEKSLPGFDFSLYLDQIEEQILRVNIYCENINDLSKMLIILCEIRPTLATSISRILMALVTRLLRENINDARGAELVWSVTEIINNSYKICLKNGFKDVCLELTHIYLDWNVELQERLLRSNVTKIVTIWCEQRNLYQTALDILKSSSKTITTLCLPYVDEHADLNVCSSLKALTISPNGERNGVYLDISRCQQIKYLDIAQPNLSLNINTNRLRTFNLWYYSFSRGNCLETLRKNCKLIHLELWDCTFPVINNCENKFHLDLSSCIKLQNILISSEIVSVSINTTNLQKCHLKNIDLSQGNLLKALGKSISLTRLELYSCNFSKEDGRQKQEVTINMSTCATMSFVRVEDSDVKVRDNSIERNRTELKTIHSSQNEVLDSGLNVYFESFINIPQFFIFLCRTMPSLALSVSQVVMALTKGLLKKNSGEYTNGSIVKKTTDTVNNGYKSCVQKGQCNFCLELTHIYIDSEYSLEEKLLLQNVNKIETIWCENKSMYEKVIDILKASSKTITRLCLPYVDKKADLNICSHLQALTIPACGNRPAVCLDMSKCQHIQYIDIAQKQLSLYINTDQLHTLYLWYYDFANDSFLESLTRRNSKLKHLELWDCTFPRVNSKNKWFHLDLTLFSSLKSLLVSGDIISVSMDTTCLQKCHLRNIDLSQGNLLKALSNSSGLKQLELYDCCFPKKEVSKFGIDLTLCSNLSFVHIVDSDVIVMLKQIC